MKSLLGGAFVLFAGLKAAENIKEKYHKQRQAKLGLEPTSYREIAASLAHPQG